MLRNFGGYAAMDYRNSLSKEKSTDDYMRKYQEQLKCLTVNKFSISGVNDNEVPITDSLGVEINDQAEIIGDKILIKPLLYESLLKNIYTLEERTYPVNYNYPVSETVVFNYTLPSGYTVESLPKSITMKMPDNSMSVNYSIALVDNKIQVLYKRNINKVLFLPSEYAGLKQIYDQIVKTHSEPIILKKII